MREGLKILHVARRYGPVGGMERYVWEVTRELVALGHQVEVVCEHCHAEPLPGITVHELGEIAARPRWVALLRFSNRFARWLHENPRPGYLIHSNERLDCHHVTTFHGPPFATVRDRPWWKKISLRIAMQLWLERRELRIAQAIVPNSAIIRNMLAHYYPEYAHKLTVPVEPGVTAGVVREFRTVSLQGGVVGFVGKEWQRKGLPLIAAVVAKLRRSRPQLELWVVGPAPEEIRHLFAGWHGGYRLLGWRSDNDYLQDFDVLLHPARAEPYGMVIAEAMAAQVPVVVSDVCGAAASVGSESGAVLSLSAPVGAWADAVEAQLRRTAAPPCFDRNWRVVAAEYETIYTSIPNGEK